MKVKSNLIKMFRAYRNEKQKNVADFLGISEATYSHLENNPEKYTHEQLEKLAAYLNVNVISFYEIETEETLRWFFFRGDYANLFSILLGSEEALSFFVNEVKSAIDDTINAFSGEKTD